MIRILAAAGVFAGSLIAFAAPASAAEEFYATPLQHGAPRDLPGEQLVPGVDLAVDVIDGVTRPLLSPVLALDEPAVRAAAGPKPHARHHHAGHRRSWQGKKAVWHRGAARKQAKVAGHHKVASLRKVRRLS